MAANAGGNTGDSGRPRGTQPVISLDMLRHLTVIPSEEDLAILHRAIIAFDEITAEMSDANPRTLFGIAAVTNLSTIASPVQFGWLYRTFSDEAWATLSPQFRVRSSSTAPGADAGADGAVSRVTAAGRESTEELRDGVAEAAGASDARPRTTTPRRRPATFELAPYKPEPPRVMPNLPEIQTKAELSDLLLVAATLDRVLVPSEAALGKAEAALPSTWERHVRAEFTTALFKFYQLSKGRVTSITRDYGLWTPKALLAGKFDIGGTTRPLCWAAGTAMTNRLHAKLVLAASLDASIVDVDIAAMHENFCKQVENHLWDAEPAFQRQATTRRGQPEGGATEAPAPSRRRLDENGGENAA
jgi:hypothetical protein